MNTDIFTKPIKTVLHLDDPVTIERHRVERPLPLGPQAKLNAQTWDLVVEVELLRNPEQAKNHPKRRIAFLHENSDSYGYLVALLADRNVYIADGQARLEAVRCAFDKLTGIRI
jgi:hypothetical protein